MQIIGEKLNGTRKRVAQAIADRDTDFIKSLAVKQTEAGSAWLDVNAGTHPEREPDDLVWLVKTVQSTVDIPLCLDSANPQALQAAIKAVDKTPMINSISGEPDRLESVLPLVAEYDCPVIALAMGDKKIPEISEQRVAIIRQILSKSRAAGVPDEHIYCDPLALTIATNPDSAVVAFQTMQTIKAEFPEVHLTIGLSNISFGLPARKVINRTFLTLAMQAGLDSAILDPLDRDIRAAILATELVLGRDEYCMNYVKAARAGAFDE